MDSTFEVFLGGTTTAPHNKLHVSINRHNVIVLNANCYRQMGRPEAVRLAFSRHHQTIAIIPCSPRFNEAFPLLAHGHSGHRVNAAPFCRHFNIRIDGTLRFIDPHFEGERGLHLDLKKVVSVARTGPTRKRKQA